MKIHKVDLSCVANLDVTSGPDFYNFEQLTANLTLPGAVKPKTTEFS